MQLCFTAVGFGAYLFAVLGTELQLKAYCILDNILPPNVEILEIKNKRKALFAILGKCMLIEWGLTYSLHGRHSLSDSLISKLVPPSLQPHCKFLTESEQTSVLLFPNTPLYIWANKGHIALVTF